VTLAGLMRSHHQSTVKRRRTNSIISKANEISGAKRGANGGRRQATQGDVWRQSLQLAGPSGDGRRRPATVKLRLTSEGALVRTQLRPPVFAARWPFETLIGDPVTTAGNHRCMLPDGGRVPAPEPGRLPPVAAGPAAPLARAGPARPAPPARPVALPREQPRTSMK
jgi:hypothetical protein